MTKPPPVPPDNQSPNVAECALVPCIEPSTEMNAPSLSAVDGMLTQSARACEALRAENFQSNSSEQLGSGTESRW